MNAKRWRSELAGFVALIGLALALCSSARAEPVEDFYRGRQVSIVIGNGPGGGYDAYGRLLARHIGRYIPGSPTVVAQNMPGAGGLKAVLYASDVAARDGTVMATVIRTQPVAPLLTGAKFDALALTWIGSITDEASLCLTAKGSKATSWQDLRGREIPFAGQGAGADPDVFAQTLNKFLGTHIKLILAYNSTHEIALAMQRGEVEGACGISAGTVVAQHANWMAKGEANFLLQMAPAKDPRFAGVPLVGEVVEGEKDRQAVALIVASQAIARPFFAPPGIPAERKEALRTAFDRTMADPQFRAEAEKAQMEVRPMRGAEVEALLRKLYATPKDVVAAAAAAIGN